MKAFPGGQYCAFSVATEDRVKGEKTTTWVGCSLFGKRGEALCKHLTKGSKVTVMGRLLMRDDKNGKAHLNCDVSDVELQGGGNRDGGQRHAPASGGDDFGSGTTPEDDFGF
jgi:single-strand DNA-binding protein